MNKVFIICSEFLPVRNGGTIRCEKLAKYFPVFGWETVVLSKKPSSTSNVDNSLTIDKCKIYSTKRYDLVKLLSTLKNRFQKFAHSFSFRKIQIDLKENSLNIPVVRKRMPSEYFFVPDGEVLWALITRYKALKVFKKEKAQIIFSSSPSHSVHIIGMFLKKKTSAKWVVEFRDPWTLNPFHVHFPLKIMNKLNSYLERKTIENSDAIIVTSEQFKYDFLEKYPHIMPNKITYNPNGFDTDDFINIKPLQYEKYTITHAGNFYINRKSVFFIQAILDIFNENPDLQSSINVNFIGQLDLDGLNLISKSPYKDAFKIKDFVPHKEALTEMCSADLLLLVPGPGTGTMTGKIFEYIASKKPILCLANEGPTIPLIIKNNLGEVADPYNINEIKTKLLFLIKNGKSQKLDSEDQTISEFFSRKNIAARNAMILDSLLNT